MHSLARVHWAAYFDKLGDEPVTFDVTYLVRVDGDGPRVVLYISHEDENDLLREKGLSLATMESCSGGLLASTLTDVAGSSDYFKGGLVAYSAEAKAAFGVDKALLAEKGTVDPDVAAAMASAARMQLGADIGIGVTGVAGPSEVEGKPVGTVHIALDAAGKERAISGRYPPRRLEVKRRAVYSALFELRKLLLE